MSSPFGTAYQRESSGVLRLMQIRSAAPGFWKNLGNSSRRNRRNRKSPIRIPKTPSAFDQCAQGNALRHRSNSQDIRTSK
jgi:hypothetical protein